MSAQGPCSSCWSCRRAAVCWLRWALGSDTSSRKGLVDSAHVTAPVLPGFWGFILEDWESLKSEARQGANWGDRGP